MGSLGLKNITNKIKSSMDRYICRLDTVEEKINEAKNIRRNIQAKV